VSLKSEQKHKVLGLDIPNTNNNPHKHHSPSPPSIIYVLELRTLRFTEAAALVAFLCAASAAHVCLTSGTIILNNAFIAEFVETVVARLHQPFCFTFSTHFLMTSRALQGAGIRALAKMR
jgi:hypothetical protein